MEPEIIDINFIYFIGFLLAVKIIVIAICHRDVRRAKKIQIIRQIQMNQGCAYSGYQIPEGEYLTPIEE